MYIDVLFALNFMMDIMVLLAASWTLGLPVKWKRLLLAAVVGAFGGCLLTVGAQVSGMKVLKTGVGEVLSGILLCIPMVKIAFGANTRQAWVRNVLAVYGISFLLGGMLSWLQVHMSDDYYFAAVGISFGLFCLGQFLYKRLQERTKAMCNVNVQMAAGTVSLKGLLDTGNLLAVPIVGTPVTVVWVEALYPGMTKEQQEQYTYIRDHWELPENTQMSEEIKAEAEVTTGALKTNPSLSDKTCWQLIPYRSVGCPAGLLPVLKVPCMFIQTEQQEAIVKNALLGLCPHPLSGSKAYEMILNPKLINNGLKGD